MERVLISVFFFLSCMFLLFLLVLDVTSAQGVEIEKKAENSIVISELSNPAVFEFSINNLGKQDTFEIYSFVGFSMTPRGTFDLPPGKTILEVTANPNKEVRKSRGFYQFEYQLRGQNAGITKDTLLIKLVSLQEIFEITAEPINPEDTAITVRIQNKENIPLENLSVRLTSRFFDKGERLTLGPSEIRDISLPLDRERMRGIAAGSYPATAAIILDNKEVEFDMSLDYREREGIRVERFSDGIIMRRTSVKKTNDGNTPIVETVEIRKDILSRFLTLEEPMPYGIEREGLFVTYRWRLLLNPGESMIVSTTSNYTLPTIILAIIILGAFAVRVCTRTPMTLHKNVSFIKTKSGHFAFKVKLSVKAQKDLEHVRIIDRLPSAARLYEQFGRMPDEVDQNAKRLTWNIEKLNAGEVRIYSYIIYTPLHVIGRYELPYASASFIYKNKHASVVSNKAFFMAETIHTNMFVL